MLLFVGCRRAGPKLSNIGSAAYQGAGLKFMLFQRWPSEPATQCQIWKAREPQLVKRR
jgi:hypothetical protein